MEFRILGSVELRVDGQPCQLGPAKERQILAILLLAPGQPVSIDALIDRVWGDKPPSNARGNIHSYTSRLRGRLTRHLGESVPRLIRRSGSYVLEVDPETVDLHCFFRLNAQARAIAASGNSADALRLLRDSEKLWRGEPLSGLSGEWVTKMRTSLENEHRAAIGTRIAMELDTGRHAEVVGELHTLAHQYPYDESFVEYLMLALYRCGRQGEALEAYHRASHRLVEDLGTEPGPSLRQIYERILRGDPALATPPARSQVPPGPMADNLPRDIPEFTGRQAELSRLYDELERSPSTVTIAALDGMAGAGKTALAVHLAHVLADRYPDGRWFLHLRAHDPHQPPVDPVEGLEVLLRLLGEDPKSIPDSLEPRAALWRARIAGRRMLIVLDDAAGAEQVRPFLPGGPGCLVLITSRRRLAGLEGARPLSLDALIPSDAALLFRRIVGRERRLDASEVNRLVALCGHLPLAVTIMANKLRHRPARGVSELVTKLSQAKDRLAEMYAGESDLRTAFDLSYRELSPDTRQAFRRLGLHIGDDLTAGAAAALIGYDLTRTERILEELIDRHLVEEPESGRIRFHDLLRAYARERAIKEEQAEEIRRAVHRLLDFYLHTADRADRLLHPYRRRAVVDVTHVPASPSVENPAHASKWLRAERANLLMCAHYAADYGFVTHAVQLSQAIATHLERSAHWREAVRVHEAALRACQVMDDRAGGARVELELSLVHSRLNHYEAAFELAGRGLSTLRALDDLHGQAHALDHLSRVSWMSGHLREALNYAEQALRQFRAIEDQYGEGMALVHLGVALWHLGAVEEAMAVFETSLEVVDGTGDLDTKAMTLNNLGEMYFHSGEYQRALGLFQEAHAILRETGWQQYEAVAVNNIANCYQRTGRHDEALHFYRESLTIHRESGDRRHEADTLCNIGAAYLDMNLDAEALIHFQKALSIAQEIGDRYQWSRALQKMGDIKRKSGDLSLARKTYEEALALARDLGDPFLEASSLQGLGEALLHTRGREAAERAWRQALAIFERIGSPEAAILRQRL